MKLKLTETQYISLLNYINEARQSTMPTSLSGFFKKNPDTAYFTIVKLIQKTKDESEYLFSYEYSNGFHQVKDLNQGTVTKGCGTYANLDTMIYDDEFSLTFGQCNKTLTINNVVGIRLLDKNRNKIDEMKFNNTSTSDVGALVDKYNNELKTSNNGDEVYFKTPKREYAGIVYNKTSDTVEIELKPTDEKKYLVVNLNNDGFYEQNGKIFFQATKKTVIPNPNAGLNSEIKTTETDFNIPIKSFSTSNSTEPKEPEVNEPEPEEPEVKEPEVKEPEVKEPEVINPKSITPLSDEELEAQAKLAYDEILNDKDLQKAFYRKPNFWNLFMGELKGERAPGKGIYPTMQIVKGYKSNKIDNRLKGQFVEGEQVYYQPYHNKDIHIYSKNEKGENDELLETIPAKAESKAKVEHLNLGDNTKQLVHRENYNKLIITIKEPTEIQDVYLCDLTKENKTGKKGKKTVIGTEPNVYLKFNPKSKGYKPLKLTQTQTKP